MSPKSHVAVAVLCVVFLYRPLSITGQGSLKITGLTKNGEDVFKGDTITFFPDINTEFRVTYIPFKTSEIYWIINDVEVVQGSSTVFSLRLNNQLHNTVLNCTVKNSDGQDTILKTIIIVGPPTLSLTPSVVIRGQPTIVSCQSVYSSDISYISLVKVTTTDSQQEIARLDPNRTERAIPVGSPRVRYVTPETERARLRLNYTTTTTTCDDAAQYKCITTSHIGSNLSSELQSVVVVDTKTPVQLSALETCLGDEEECSQCCLHKECSKNNPVRLVDEQAELVCTGSVSFPPGANNYFSWSKRKDGSEWQRLSTGIQGAHPEADHPNATTSHGQCYPTESKQSRLVYTVVKGDGPLFQLRCEGKLELNDKSTYTTEATTSTICVMGAKAKGRAEQGGGLALTLVMAIVGGVLALIIGIAVIAFVIRKRRKKAETTSTNKDGATEVHKKGRRRSSAVSGRRRSSRNPSLVVSLASNEQLNSTVLMNLGPSGVSGVVIRATPPHDKTGDSPATPHDKTDDTPATPHDKTSDTPVTPHGKTTDTSHGKTQPTPHSKSSDTPATADKPASSNAHADSRSPVTQGKVTDTPSDKPGAGERSAGARNARKAEDPKSDVQQSEDPKIHAQQSEDPKSHAQQSEDPKVQARESEDPKSRARQDENSKSDSRQYNPKSDYYSRSEYVSRGEITDYSPDYKDSDKRTENTETYGQSRQRSRRSSSRRRRRSHEKPSESNMDTYGHKGRRSSHRRKSHEKPSESDMDTYGPKSHRSSHRRKSHETPSQAASSRSEVSRRRRGGGTKRIIDDDSSESVSVSDKCWQGLRLDE